MTLKRTLAILLCFLCIPCARAQKSKPIEKQEIADWFNKMPDCSEQPRFYFSKLEYFDFTGSGTKQAIVVASDCASGTGGPNIHSVISRDSDGELEELKIAEVDAKTYDNLFGNRNYTLSVENGLLVATFSDDPDRDNTPLTIKYKWEGEEFAAASIEKTGIYPTSYNCTKNVTEIENVICHVDTLAGLDVQLGDLYKSLLAKLTGPQRETLREEQRKWLSARDKACAIYKGWIRCLSDYYQKRVDELKTIPYVSPTQPRLATESCSPLFPPSPNAVPRRYALLIPGYVARPCQSQRFASSTPSFRFPSARANCHYPL